MKKTKYYATTTCKESTLTAGKKYDVFVSDEGSEDSLNSFYIKSDTGNTLTCLREECAHIKFGDWEISEKEEVISPAFSSSEINTLLLAINDSLLNLTELKIKLTKLNK